MNATATLPQLTREEIMMRRRRLGWSQNELARRIRKDPGMVSKVLAGKAVSGIVMVRIQRVLLREESRRTNGAT